MVRDSILTVEGHTLTAHLVPDFDANNPRTEFEGLATFVGFNDHRHPIEGDEEAGNLTGLLLDLLEGADSRAYWILSEANERGRDVESLLMARVAPHFLVWPLYRRQDGSTFGSRLGGGDFDASPAGAAYLSLAKVAEEYEAFGVDDPHGHAEAYVQGEIQEYGDWASGSVYGVIIEDPETGRELDSCWGFYGSEHAEDSAKEMLKEAESALLTLTAEGGRARIADRVTEIDLTPLAPFAADTADWERVADILLAKHGYAVIGPWKHEDGVSTVKVTDSKNVR